MVTDIIQMINSLSSRPECSPKGASEAERSIHEKTILKWVLQQIIKKLHIWIH